MKQKSYLDRRKHARFPIIKQIDKGAKMYLSPPLIMDPVEISLKELSGGGMKLFTKSPIPTRFLFAVVFNAPFASKIYAEAKIMHVNKVKNGYMVGASFVAIKPEMREQIEVMAVDFNNCESVRAKENKKFCKANCSYMPICTKKHKLSKKVAPNKKPVKK